MRSSGIRVNSRSHPSALHRPEEVAGVKFVLQPSWAAVAANSACRPLLGHATHAEICIGPWTPSIWVPPPRLHSFCELWGPPAADCPSCTGLPEEVAVVKHVLQSSWAAVAFSSLDREATRCWEVYRAPRDSLDSPQAGHNT